MTDEVMGVTIVIPLLRWCRPITAVWRTRPILDIRRKHTRLYCVCVCVCERARVLWSMVVHIFHRVRLRGLKHCVWLAILFTLGRALMNVCTNQWLQNHRKKKGLKVSVDKLQEEIWLIVCGTILSIFSGYMVGFTPHFERCNLLDTSDCFQGFESTDVPMLIKGYYLTEVGKYKCALVIHLHSHRKTNFQQYSSFYVCVCEISCAKTAAVFCFVLFCFTDHSFLSLSLTVCVCVPGTSCAGWYISLVLKSIVGVGRFDSLAMEFHHFVTLALIIWSYTTGFTQIGEWKSDTQNMTCRVAGWLGSSVFSVFFITAILRQNLKQLFLLISNSRCSDILYLQSKQSYLAFVKVSQLFGMEAIKNLFILDVCFHLLLYEDCTLAHCCD